MKKIIFVLLVLFITGCSSSGNTDTINCIIDNKNAEITLKDGMVVKYTLNGKEESQKNIDEINGLYFASATNNEEGREALNNYISTVNGSCES